jgi:hypothetical protein
LIVSSSANPADGPLYGVSSAKLTSNSETIYVAVGSSVDLSTAQLYYSADVGDSWTLTSSTTEVRFFYGVSVGTNGKAYMIGEKYKIYQATYDDTYSTITTVFDPTAAMLSLSSSSLKRYHFSAVCTVDGENTIVVGNLGLIFYSNDFGATWLSSSSTGISTALDVNAVSCLSPLVAVTSGANSYVSKTSDGGATWTVLSVFNSASYSSYGISIVNSNVIFVSGFILDDSASQGSVYKSFDGGNTWTLDTSSLYNIYSLAMYSTILGSAGMVTGSPNAIYTRVSGNLFSSINKCYKFEKQPFVFNL